MSMGDSSLAGDTLARLVIHCSASEQDLRRGGMQRQQVVVVRESLPSRLSYQPCANRPTHMADDAHHQMPSIRCRVAVSSHEREFAQGVPICG
jgi:hypothetical protein